MSYFCEIKFKDIKKSLKIIGLVVGGIIIFFSLIFFLLQIRGIQQLIVETVTKDISKRIQSEVRIGEIDYKFFNTVSLKDVYVGDLQGDTLLYIDELDARFRFFQFFRKRVIFHSIEINGLHGNMQIDEAGRSNFDFLIEAFKPREDKSSFDVEYSIRHIRINDTSFAYDNYYQQAVELEPGQIDFNHLRFNDVSTEIALNILTSDTLNARILNFKAKEQSGLEIVDIHTKVDGSHSGLNMPGFYLKLPSSQINIENVSLKYDSIADFRDFSNKVQLTGELNNSILKIDDISPFVPVFKGMDALVTVNASLDGTLASLRMPQIKIQYGESFLLNGSLNLSGLPDLAQTFVFANIKQLHFNGNDLEKFASDIAKEQFNLPDEVKRLGAIKYSGNISGFFSNMVLYGNLSTDIGSVSTDILLQFENDFKDMNYNGTMKSEALDLGKMMQREQFGNLAFYFNTVGSRKMNSSFQGIIDANVPELYLNGYTYQDIQFKGEYDGTGFNGSLKIEDDNINVNFNGLIDLAGKIPVFDFEIIVKETNLNALNLIENYPGALLSFDMKTKMTGNSLDNINGYVSLDSIVFINGDKRLDANDIQLVSRTENNYTNFTIVSDYVNGSIYGDFNYSYLKDIYSHMLNEYLPTLGTPTQTDKMANRINISLNIDDIQEITEVLDIPHTITGKSVITGYADDANKVIDIVATVPKLTFGERDFENTRLYIWGKEQKLEVIVETDIPTENDYWNFSLITAAYADSAALGVEWSNKQKIVNKGAIKTITAFKKDEQNDIYATTSIFPTNIVLSDSTWNVSQASIDFYSDKSFDIKNVRLGNSNQYLNIDGVVSKNQQDSLSLKMKDVDLGFFTGLANMKGFTFGGEITGELFVLSVLEKPVFDAVLAVKDLNFNNKIVGDASVFSTWDQMNEQVIAIASIVNNNEAVALAECTYALKENQLDINIDVNRLSIDFLTPYYDKVLPNTGGLASGKLHIGGPMGAIRFDARLKVDEGQVMVGILGTTYTLNDSIFLTPNAIEFPNVTVYDEEKNKVIVNGALRHNGSFKNFVYDLDIQSRNAIVVNLKPGENDLLFGKVYGDADVSITGNDDLVNIRVNALTRAGSKAYIQVATTSKATDAGFIQFVDHDKPDEPFRIALNRNPQSTSTLKLDLQIEVTPETEVGLIINPAGGDMITGKGRGNIRVEYDDSQTDVKMYGSYVLESGNYVFTLDVFRKEFKIENGSSIYWSGSPSNAQVNIRAVHSLNASLRDLMDQTTLERIAKRATVPVNCILVLTDNLTSPTIKFEIELPTADEQVKQYVNNVISTEEMMTRQILYLLVFNKFYAPEGIAENSSSGGEFLSLATSTVSSQMNNILSQMSNKISFGLDAQIRDEDKVEWQAEIMYQPNDRWIVNGNFGYREPIATDQSNNDRFVTDIDVEYLITQSGKLRIKFYNHTIDRTRLKNAHYTQGIGVMYKEDFDTVGDLFKYYWRILTGKNRKERKEKNETDN